MPELFFFNDSGPLKNRILIFGKAQCLEILRFSKIWFCDRTFKISPSVFSQVFVVLEKTLYDFRPFMYALISNKKKKHILSNFSKC